MSDDFNGFVRKQFSVEAARVTPLNIKEIAEACGGRIMHDGSKENQFSRDYIKVRVVLPLNDEQTKARIGDWVVRQGRTFKVYKDAAFRKTFENPDGTPVSSEKAQPKPEKKVDKAREEAESVKNEKPSDAPKKSVTLDELNKRPGDPRTANEINLEK